MLLCFGVRTEQLAADTILKSHTATTQRGYGYR